MKQQQEPSDPAPASGESNAQSRGAQIQKPDPVQLLQLLQKQVPDPYRQLQENNLPKNIPRTSQIPPQPSSQPQLMQPFFGQVLQPIPLVFPPQQAQLMGLRPGQVLHPFPPPFLFHPDGQPAMIPVPHPVQIPNPRPQPSQQHVQNGLKPRDRSERAKKTTSFVPTQVLAGRRGGSAPIIGGKKSVKKTFISDSAEGNSHEKSSLLAQASKENLDVNKEVSIDALLEEAEKRQKGGGVNGKPVNTLTTEAGQELLSKLTSQFSGIAVQESSVPKTGEGGTHPSPPPSKSPIAANFSFSP